MVEATINVFSMSGRMRSLYSGAVHDDDPTANAEALKKFVVSGLEGFFVTRRAIHRIAQLDGEDQSDCTKHCGSSNSNTGDDS